MARKKPKYHWKRTRAGCRCVKSSERMVKASKCKGKKSPCSKKRRKAAPAMPPMPPPVMMTAPTSPIYSSGLQGWWPRRRYR